MSNVLIRFSGPPGLEMIDKLRAAMLELDGSRPEVGSIRLPKVTRMQEDWQLPGGTVQLQHDSLGVYLEGPSAVIDGVRELVSPLDDW